LEGVKKVRKDQPKVGGKKLHRHLKADVVNIGRDKLFDILREEDLLVKKTKKYVRTTQSNHWLWKYSNLVKDVDPIVPEQIYASDITYLDTMEGFCYLSLITDIYSRKIVGWAVSESLSIEGCLEALKMAIRDTKETEGLIHHSDRGIQYCSKAYVRLLKKNKIKISMTEENHVYENALAERVNGILKTEFLLGEKLRSIKIARKLVAETVETYNNKRLHMSLDYITPTQKHAA